MNEDAKKFDIEEVVWRQPDGELVSCEEKLVVLRENLDEIQQQSQDALEDAILMGCDEAQVREVFDHMIRALENPYVKK